MISLSRASTASFNAATQLPARGPFGADPAVDAPAARTTAAEAKGATWRDPEKIAASFCAREKRISRTTPSPPGQRPLPPLPAAVCESAFQAATGKRFLKDFRDR